MKAIKDDPIAFLNASTHLIIGRKLADRYGLKLKDTVPIQTPTGVQAFQIWGFIEDEGVGRAFGGNCGRDVLPGDAGGLRRGTRIDRVDVALAPSAPADDVSAAIAAALGPGYEANRPDRRNAQVSQMLGGLNLALTMGSRVAILVGMFLIYNTMSISVVQRKRELGILRALGTTKRQILVLFTLEGFLLGCVGSALGVFRPLFLARFMLAALTASVNEIYLQVAATEVHVDPLLVTAGFGLGVLGAVASAFVPAREATRVSAIETLRTGRFTPQAPRRGFTARPMAVRSPWPSRRSSRGPCRPSPASPMARSRPRRSCSSASRWCCLASSDSSGGPSPPAGGRRSASRPAWPTTTCRGTSGARRSPPARSWSASRSRSPSGIFWSSFKTSTLEVGQPDGPGGHLHHEWRPLQRREEHARWPTRSGSRSRPSPAWPRSTASASSTSSTAICPSSCSRPTSRSSAKHSQMTFLQGDAATSVPAVLQGDAMVSENLARRLDLKVGDAIKLAAPTGERSYRLAGVILDYTSDQGTVILDRATMIRDWNDAVWTPTSST
jgi:ABC-type lipoprotein release transport system permease subunit